MARLSLYPSPDVPLSLQIAQVFVDGGERLISKMLGDFLEAWRVSVPFDRCGDVVKDFVLLSGQRHGKLPYVWRRDPEPKIPEWKPNSQDAYA